MHSVIKMKKGVARKYSAIARKHSTLAGKYSTIANTYSAIAGKYSAIVKFGRMCAVALLDHRMCLEQCESVHLTTSGWLDGYLWMLSIDGFCSGCALAHGNAVHDPHGLLRYCKKLSKRVPSVRAHLSERLNLHQ